MAKRYRPRSVQGISSLLSKNIFIQAKLLRRAIDRNKKVKQITNLDSDYSTKFDKLKTATEKAVAEHGVSSRKLLPKGEGLSGGNVQIRTANRFFSGNANFRQQGAFFRQLFPEMVENHELGHKNIGVLTANIGLALDVLEKEDPRRAQLRALFVISQKIDSFTDKEDIEGLNVQEILGIAKQAAVRKRKYSVEYKNTVDIITGVKGKIELEYEPIGLNQAKGKASAFIGGLFKDLIEDEDKRVNEFLENLDISNLQGSPRIGKLIEVELLKALDKRVKGRKSKVRKTDSSTTKRDSPSQTKRKKLKAGSPGSTARKGVSASPLALIGLINKKLPDTVRRNMLPPALENQTGRFADSVRLTDVVQTAQGFPSFGYTYQKDPYQVFELGQGSPPWATAERDPRRLIDKSIREIAAQFAIGRFYTRRE